jgi:hypothetical protein
MMGGVFEHFESTLSRHHWRVMGRTAAEHTADDTDFK